MKAIIFDMDGVLIDSVPMQVEAFRRFFEQYHVPFGPEQLKRFNGPSTREILEIMKQEHQLAYSLDEAVAERNRIGKEVLKNAQPFSGARQTVEAFRLRGYRVGLASSAPKDIIAHLCSGWPFDAVVSGEDVVRSKPDPQIFLKAAEKLGISPGECAVVEDSPLGIVAAKAAGMYTIGITNTTSADQLGSDAVITDIQQTLTLAQLVAQDVLFQPKQPTAIDNIEVKLSKDRPVLPPALAQEIETDWAALAKTRTVYNGLIANLLHMEARGKTLTLVANTTDYKTYRGLRSRNDYDIFAHGVCVLGTSGLVITSDDQAIFARRGKGLVGEGMLYNIPCGILNIDKSASVKESLYGEMHQEMKIVAGDVRSCSFIGMGHDLISKGAELLFAIRVNKTAQEIIALQSQAMDAHEAYALRAVPLNELSQFIAAAQVMPASKAIAQCYLTTRQVNAHA